MTDTETSAATISVDLAARDERLADLGRPQQRPEDGVATSEANRSAENPKPPPALEAEAEQPLSWTKPDDLVIDWKTPMKGRELWKRGTKSAFLAAYCDGSVHAISEKIDIDLMKKLLQKDDGQPIGEVP